MPSAKTDVSFGKNPFHFQHSHPLISQRKSHFKHQSTTISLDLHRVWSLTFYHLIRLHNLEQYKFVPRRTPQTQHAPQCQIVFINKFTALMKPPVHNGRTRNVLWHYHLCRIQPEPAIRAIYLEIYETWTFNGNRVERCNGSVMTLKFFFNWTLSHYSDPFGKQKLSLQYSMCYPLCDEVCQQSPNVFRNVQPNPPDPCTCTTQYLSPYSHARIVRGYGVNHIHGRLLNS